VSDLDSVSSQASGSEPVTMLRLSFWQIWNMSFGFLGIQFGFALQNANLAMPYAILAGSIPSGKMGIYMGIFNFFIVIPQIINGILGGPMVKHAFGGQAIYSLVLAGFSLLGGCFCCFR